MTTRNAELDARVFYHTGFKSQMTASILPCAYDQQGPDMFWYVEAEQTREPQNRIQKCW